MIKAPYNFVPVSDTVVRPEWASLISHDVPFSDGVSGTITVQLTTKSPIFVRNGYSKDEGKNKTGRYQSFCHDENGNYFIPATTVKGAIRNILEIMSFGKMRIDKNMKFMQRKQGKKLPYARTPLECLSNAHRSNDYDLAECIFGATDEKSSLRGRVQFSHFYLSTSTDVERKCVTLALGSPKASYYPIYIDQSGNGRNGLIKIKGNYKTYNDGGLKGWKRYLNRERVWRAEAKADVCTRIYPLASSNPNCGLVFEGKIRFHNLRPEELGALLSALTFHGNQNGACHQIGAAKPYGYGRVAATVTALVFHPEGNDVTTLLQRICDYMLAFENYMDSQLKTIKWKESRQIKELIMLASNQVPAKDSWNYEYMKLYMFQKAKGTRDTPSEYLRYYSELVGNASVKSLTDNISS